MATTSRNTRTVTALDYSESFVVFRRGPAGIAIEAQDRDVDWESATAGPFDLDELRRVLDQLAATPDPTLGAYQRHEKHDAPVRECPDPALHGMPPALARAVAAVTPCSCSAQRARAEKAEKERGRWRDAAKGWEKRAIAAENLLADAKEEQPTVTVHRAADPNHLYVVVEHPWFATYQEKVHIPNTSAEVAEQLRVSFSSEEVLIEHPLIGRHARALDIPVSDEMAERAREEFFGGDDVGGPVTGPASTRRWRAALTAALTEPPARPEGAEKLAEVIDGLFTGDEGIYADDLADSLARCGVRVVGEERS